MKSELKKKKIQTVFPIVRVFRCLISSFIELLLEVDVTCVVFVLGVRSEGLWCFLAGSGSSYSHISRCGK